MNVSLVLISDGWGGAETVVYELARHLRDKGENVSIILNQEIIKFYNDLEDVEIFNIGYAYHPKRLIKSIISSKLIVDEKSDTLHSSPWNFLNEFLRPIYFRRIRKEIIRFLSEKKVDVVHSHLMNSDILVSCLKHLKIPWIGTIHGPYLLRLQKKDIRSVLTLKKSKAKMLGETLYKMDKIIFVSNWLLNTFKDIMPTDDKSVVIHNGIKLSEFQRNLIPTLKLKGNFNLLFPGGGKLWKGIDLLIVALNKVKNKIPDVHLYITRNVSQNHLLKKMVKDFGLEEKVTFSDHLPLPEYRSLLNSIDVLCMPSKKEAFGIVFLEAMAMGKPLIAANRGGIPEFIVNERNGILIEPNSDEIADAILYLYKNKDLRNEMGRNNLEDIKKYNWSPIVDKYIEVYKNELEEKS
jgi:glycosyltransferase involved in cell wall biosynthesis